MKKLLLVVLITLLGSSCEEIPPVVTPAGPQEICGGATRDLVADQKRQVLIEEFTGVQCVNCPAGSKAIQDLIDIHGKQLIAVSIHAGSFSPPYDESLYDFRTEDGSELIDFLGNPIGYPTAVINRKIFEGEFDLQLGRNLWPGFVVQEKNVDPVVKIQISKSFESTTRQLDTEVTVFVEEDLSVYEGIRLTVMVTENEVADFQLTPDGLQADYVHQHILRDVLTNFSGIAPEGEITAGAIFCNSFSTVLPAEWLAENIDLIAFVSVAGESKEVLQAHKVRLLE